MAGVIVKGIAHFAVGVAFAASFPWAVREGASGNPLYFLLGGFAGLIPDTLDFKFWRFLYRQDILVVPDQHDPDPGPIARALAQAVTMASNGRPIRIKLESMRLGTDRWRRYTVRFDPDARTVTVLIGPVVDTGRCLIERGKDMGRAATAPIPVPLRLDYFATFDVDAFEGPHVRMVPDLGGSVMVEFIPWHRSWSHGLAVAGVLGVLGTLVWDWRAGLVMAGAQMLHAILDQAGYLGNNAWFPLTRHRKPGGKYLHSGDSVANATVVWYAGLWIWYNLWLGSDVGGEPLRVIQTLLLAALLPLLAIAWRGWRNRGPVNFIRAYLKRVKEEPHEPA